MMNDNALKFARYWRNSLADAEQGKGSFKKKEFESMIKDSQSIEVDQDILRSGCVSEEVVNILFAGESQQTLNVEVTIRPWTYIAAIEHGQAINNSAPMYVTPIISHALVNRHGQLFPSINTTIPRDLLEPLEAKSFAIGSLDRVDDFLTKSVTQCTEPPEDGSKLDDVSFCEQWGRYVQHATQLLEEVGQGWPKEEDCYQRSAKCYLYKEQRVSGASEHVVRLYDSLRKDNPLSPLFERYAEQTPQVLEQCLPLNAGFADRLGHASDTHSLAAAQRDALTHLMAANDGDILGVNGPPGTGKTTLLLSVVASLWAKAALKGGEPPVIVASSANNQAVTNIIDAFGKDFSIGAGVFAGRWLPDIKSFGAYFPAKGKEKEAASVYQTRSFFDALESPEYFAKAKHAFLGKAAAAFPNEKILTVQAVVDRLQQGIKDHSNDLKNIEASWNALLAARSRLFDALGDEPLKLLEIYRQAYLSYEMILLNNRALSQAFEQYLAKEPIFYALFNWLSPVADKRLRLARLHLKAIPLSNSVHSEYQLSEMDSWRSISEIETGLAGLCHEAAIKFEKQKALIQNGEQLIAGEQHCLSNWNYILKLLKLVSTDAVQNIQLDGCDKLVDTQIRFPIFLLATHYWEGRWLLEMEESLEEILKSAKKIGCKSIESRWRRWMKLTPCVVSTFFMVPTHLTGRKSKDGKEFVDDYMYNFIDLLIVDEAGQVLPEVAGASFALAKKSLVIGDTLQIEPIWSIPVSIDSGNLREAGLLPLEGAASAYESLASTGKSAASGSVMKIAQNASRYHYDTDMERGMFLYEHRRCYDSIIDYCNKLCYHGKLQPMRGAKPADAFPGLGYLHTDGLCQQSNGGSRHNTHEAQAIAAWLMENRSSLEAQYKKSIDKIVGVITPFGAQTQAIQRACDVHGIKTGKGNGELTVGTVHSFQGAERPVIIFSAVYSKHADGGFIDQRGSMLNVAVSRAKDSFLVFGDMDVLSGVAPSKPRGLLAEYLFSNPDNELKLDGLVRADLHSVEIGLSHLHEAAQHDKFLLQTLAKAKKAVHIVTPWLLLARIKEIGAWDAMSAAVARGVQVFVYTDKALNSECKTSLSEAANGQCSTKAAIDALKAQGIAASFLSKIHSKIVMADDDLLCIGSFNWFSASRIGPYVRHETSMVYQGCGVAKEIEVNLRSLNQRVLFE